MKLPLGASPSSVRGPCPRLVRQAGLRPEPVRAMRPAAASAVCLVPCQILARRSRSPCPARLGPSGYRSLARAVRYQSGVGADCATCACPSSSPSRRRPFQHSGTCNRWPANGDFPGLVGSTDAPAQPPVLAVFCARLSRVAAPKPYVPSMWFFFLMKPSGQSGRTGTCCHAACAFND